MKIYAIRDESVSTEKNLGFLFYYERSREFFIELPEEADEWETPLILSSFLKKGIYSINSYWSGKWVAQRIVPPDRQNLGMILKENGLKEYDPYKLLMLADGRCAQDDCYLLPIDISDLPKDIKKRLKKKVKDVIPLSDYQAIVFFIDGTVRMVDLKTIFNENTAFIPILCNEEIFDRVRVTTGGNGIEWGSNVGITAEELYSSGKSLPIKMDDFLQFIKLRTVNTTQVSQILHCSRQYINQLVNDDKLHPIRIDSNNKIFLKSEVEEYMH